MPNGSYILMELQSEDQARAVVGGMNVFTLFDPLVDSGSNKAEILPYSCAV